MKKEYTADEITEALESVYDYMCEVEQAHFAEATPSEKKNHIYQSVKALGYYLQHEE